jgi:hypothetical protein
MNVISVKNENSTQCLNVESIFMNEKFKIREIIMTCSKQH